MSTIDDAPGAPPGRDRLLREGWQVHGLISFAKS